MNPRFACLPVVLATLMLNSACSTSLSMPDFAGWFTHENEIVVYEVVNDSHCNAPDERTSVQVLAGPQAVAQWQAKRGIDLLGSTQLPNDKYVAVDLGRRSGAGNGMAVSREAALKEGVLVLKATTFVPQTDPSASPDVATSPCALVRLPDITFDSLRLIDQTGKVRASASVSGGQS